MGNWNQYILSLITCSLSCWIITQINTDPGRKELLHLISGAVLAIVILRPLHEVNYEELLYICIPNDTVSAQVLEDGEKLAAQAKTEYIKSTCEAYILARAEQLGAEIRVNISLDKDLIPIMAEITGNIDSTVRNQLQDILITDLGIPKEHQKWI